MGLLSSCSIFRHSGSRNDDAPDTTDASRQLRKTPAGAAYNEKVGQPSAIPGYRYTNAKGQDIEYLPGLNFKYAEQLDVPVELITNIALYQFIDEWWGTPYHLGGNSKDGIDCSGFTKLLEQNVFSFNVPRTSREQFMGCQRVPRQQLAEGDLVFFGTRKGITHVGVYLMNNKFVHASTSFGVMISDLDDAYWKRRFVAAGRIPPQSQTP